MNIGNLKKVCVAGWGRSGVSLVKLLLALKKHVYVTEKKERGSFPSLLVDKFQKEGAKFEFGGHSEKFIKSAELIILSPGVDTYESRVVAIAQRLHIPYVGEIEFSYWLTKANFVALTGTNGKTTTTFLTYRALKEKRKRVFLGGNIGIPLSSFVLDTKKGDIIVLEISSFQLETIIEFKPHVAALLNIEPDHLDRYKDFKDYFEAKMNLFKNMKGTDFAVLNKNISLCKDVKRRLKSKVVYFSSEFSNENYSCVYRISNVFGVSAVDCQHVFSSFNGLPHRLQFVRNIRGVTFVNDSKATNPASAVWALKNIKTPAILIAGGKDKGLNYSDIIPYLKKIKKVILLGESSLKIKECLEKSVEIVMVSSLKEAVMSSLEYAQTGDTVLFSPMCSSYDMFAHYKERGNKFMEIVNSIS